ncbi:MAG: hypothetical protein MI723_15735 [Caulobacterales bacterium]|nr:hypothetical protein [Caulobacterales bacterium]
MPELLVERPRKGMRAKLNRARLKSLAEADALPSRMGVRKQRKVSRSDTKYQTDHFGPLRRYLNAQVGRPWRKVYGEICEKADTRSTVQDHVRLHLDDFVARPSIGRDGGWLWRGRPFAPAQPAGWYRWMQLYVDPRDGLLKRVKRRKRPAARRR